MATALPRRRSVPMPAVLPVVGHLHRIARSGPVEHLLSVSSDYPDGIFKLRFGSSYTAGIRPGAQVFGYVRRPNRRSGRQGRSAPEDADRHGPHLGARRGREGGVTCRLRGHEGCEEGGGETNVRSAG